MTQRRTLELVVPVPVLNGGESLHNNHHAYPSSPTFTWAAWSSIPRGW